MRTRVAALLLLVVASAALPGCVVSLFSESSVSEDTLVRAEQLEKRMDRVERAERERSGP